MYEGSFKNGKYDGYGKLRMSNGDFYSGNWRNGKKLVVENLRRMEIAIKDSLLKTRKKDKGN